MSRRQKQVWGIVGAGALILTAAGVYLYVRSRPKPSRSMRVRRIEAIIREAEELMRHQRALFKKG